MNWVYSPGRGVCRVNSMREDDSGSSGGEGNTRCGGSFGEPRAEGKVSPQRTPPLRHPSCTKAFS